MAKLKADANLEDMIRASRVRASRTKFEHSLYGKFYRQKTKAASRGIRFLLTFAEWCDVWRKSKRLGQRGCRTGQYVMSRPGDKGAYKIGNVRVIRVGDNLREAHVGTRHSKASIAKMSLAKMGHPVSHATRAKLSQYWEDRRNVES